MVKLRRNVPSLGALTTFEAAARLGGFTKAANELGVTQAAVSRQIRALETSLGVSLFVRSHRQVVLTSAGRILSEAVSGAFITISDAIDTLREPTEPDTLTISTSLSFAHFWLLPRLPSFRAANPQIQLRVLSQDGPFDLRQGEADIVLRYGVPPFADGVSMDVLREEVFPVASPGYKAAHADNVSTARYLTRLTLIEAHEIESNWLTWPQWFQRAGLPPVERQRPLVFNHYSDAVYAAITGEGVVLGWSRLLERPLSDGRLTRVGETSTLPEEGHHLVVASQSDAKPEAIAFARWIEMQFNEPVHVAGQ